MQRNSPAPLTRHLRVRHGASHVVLEFHGEIDIAAAVEMTPHLDAVTGRREAHVVVDLRPVEFFDCSGLRLLYRARQRVLSRDGRLDLVCADPLVLRLLEVAGFCGLVPPRPTLEAVLAAGAASDPAR